MQGSVTLRDANSEFNCWASCPFLRSVAASKVVGAEKTRDVASRQRKVDACIMFVKSKVFV